MRDLISRVLRNACLSWIRKYLLLRVPLLLGFFDVWMVSLPHLIKNDDRSPLFVGLITTKEPPKYIVFYFCLRRTVHNFSSYCCCFDLLRKEVLSGTKMININHIDDTDKWEYNLKHNSVILINIFTREEGLAIQQSTVKIVKNHVSIIRYCEICDLKFKRIVERSKIIRIHSIKNTP